MRTPQGYFEKYLELINPYKDTWFVRWNVRDSEEEGCKMWDEEEFDHKPTREEIATVINQSINEKTSNKIQSGFMYNEKQIWLSEQNQLNYKMLFDSKQDGIVIKCGDDINPEYITFDKFEDFEQFYNKVTLFIYNSLKEGWELKDSIDYSVYETDD